MSFGLVFLFSYRVLYSDPFIKNLHPFLINLNTKISGTLISWFGEKVALTHSIIMGDKFSVQIIFDCCAIEPMLIYLSAMVSYPNSIRSKVYGILFGISTLFFLNIVRIISLYYFGAYMGHQTMERMHLDVWQVLIVIISLGLFLYWIQYRSIRPNTITNEVK